jgi:TonB-linked SusC/RagA family outer membrane protein
MKLYAFSRHTCTSHIQKALFFMKLTIAMLVSVFLQISFAAHAQKSSLRVKAAPLGKVLQIIQAQTGYHFLVTDQMLAGTLPVTANYINKPLNDVLAACFKDQPLSYEIRDSIIVIFRKPESDKAPKAIDKVTGQVTDDTKNPLPGVIVKVKGSTASTQTSSDGRFSINTTSVNDTLVFSFVGFVTQEVALSNRNQITVQLHAEIKSLNEVVVVAYGTQRRTATTASISTVKGAELATAPVDNITNSLTGRVAGISTRANGSQPGFANPDLHVRGIGTTGNNGALIVVDGIIRNNINEIDPQVIATVTVLKDAAAVAPYGLGGANGVILITTKRGSTGTPILTLDSYYGLQNSTYSPKMLDAQDYMRLQNEAYVNDNPTGTSLPFAATLINNYPSLHAQNPDLYPNSNAYKEIAKRNAPESQSNLQVSGGTKDVKYFAGLGFFNQDAMFAPMSYRRYTYNLNLDINATPTTVVSFSVNGAFANTNALDPGTSTYQFLRGLFKYLPTESVNYSNGLPAQSAGNSPAAVVNTDGYYHKRQTTLLSTIGLEQKLNFLPGLSFKATFSYDPTSYTEKGYHTPYYYYTQNTATTPYTYTKQISTSEATATNFTSLYENYYQNQIYTYQAYLTYHNTFGKSDVSALVVAEEKNNAQMSFGASRNNFALNIDELSLGSSDKTNFDNFGNSSTGSQVGYVYRVGYGYDGKYLVEASGRYDGHYYFAPGKRYAYFPAFSGGWVVSKESFFPKTKVIDYLKLRGSWGKAGNLAGGPFQYLSGYTLYGNAYAFGTGTTTQGSYQAVEANPNITWEVSTKSNIGFDATLLNGLVRIDGDYFWEKRTGMLLAPAITVPVEYGIALAQENAGIMKNHGFELSISSQHKFSNGLLVGLNGNFSYSQNQLVQVYESPDTYNNPNRRVTNRALGTQFGYQALGLFTTADDKNKDGTINAADGYNVTQFGTLHPGDIKYADLNGDGKIDSKDLTAIGRPVYPAITYGLTPTIAYKGFDISALFQGAALEDINTMGFQTIPFNSNNSNVSYQYYNNRWTVDNQNALYPRVNGSPTSNNTQFSSFWLVNNSYLRLKTATLGYTIPTAITQKWGIRKIRLYTSGQNVFTFSKLKFEDPEVGYSSGEQSYPLQKVFIFGLNAAF